jgi:hypothetical protein
MIMECAYYMKMSFPTVKKAQIAERGLTKLFAENREAYDSWQNNCGNLNKDFWDAYQTRFPLTSEYIKFIGDCWGNDDGQVLSGKLDFGIEESQLSRMDNQIGYAAGNVWHMADWGSLCKFIQNKYGASKIVWDTEENGIGSLDSLQLYNWEEIVRALLKNKKMLPTLIGLHEDLDALIEGVLKPHE